VDGALQKYVPTSELSTEKVSPWITVAALTAPPETTQTTTMPHARRQFTKIMLPPHLPCVAGTSTVAF
jgi:hypothetical protein